MSEQYGEWNLEADEFFVETIAIELDDGREYFYHVHMGNMPGYEGTPLGLLEVHYWDGYREYTANQEREIWKFSSGNRHIQDFVNKLDAIQEDVCARYGLQFLHQVGSSLPRYQAVVRRPEGFSNIAELAFHDPVPEVAQQVEPQAAPQSEPQQTQPGSNWFFLAPEYSH